MDLNKEIKLSDLVRRPKKKAKAPGVTKPSSAKRKRRREAGDRRPQDRRLPDRRLAGRQQRRPPKLVQLARVPLEPGVVVGGEVRDVPALAAALDRFFTENKLPRRGIRLGIGTNRIGVRTVDIDGIDDERQLGNAVRFRAHEALSIPLDQAVLDYHVVSETVGRVRGRLPARPARGRLPGADRPLRRGVPGGGDRALGHRRRGVRAAARRRAPQRRARRRRASVVVSIGHDRSTLAISDGTVCDFMRVLDWGGAKLEAAIARELGLTAAEAAELKLALDLGSDAPDDGSAPRSAPAPRSPASCRRSRAS